LGVRWGQLILPHALNALRGDGYGVLAYDYYEYEDIILLARNYSSFPIIFRPPSTITYTSDTLYVEHGIKLYSDEFNAVVILLLFEEDLATVLEHCSSALTICTHLVGT
jgi:hypothetical protein